VGEKSKRGMLSERQGGPFERLKKAGVERGRPFKTNNEGIKRGGGPPIDERLNENNTDREKR